MIFSDIARHLHSFHGVQVSIPNVTSSHSCSYPPYSTSAFELLPADMLGDYSEGISSFDVAWPELCLGLFLFFHKYGLCAFSVPVGVANNTCLLTCPRPLFELAPDEEPTEVSLLGQLVTSATQDDVEMALSRALVRLALGAERTRAAWSTWVASSIAGNASGPHAARMRQHASIMPTPYPLCVFYFAIAPSHPSDVRLNFPRPPGAPGGREPEGPRSGRSIGVRPARSAR